MFTGGASPHRVANLTLRIPACGGRLSFAARSSLVSGEPATLSEGVASVAKRTDHQIAVDDALTKFLNQHDVVHDFLAACTAELHRRFANDRRVFFYLKGSAALARYLRRWGVPEQTVNEICARSDWDTQLVINPWLPRAEWFSVFKECQAILRECLDLFEEHLLRVVAQVFAPELADPALLNGKTQDKALRGRQNELAKQLRQALADHFATVFLDTVKREGFANEGPKHWDLRWDVITALVQAEKRKDILELDIQANSQATLTSALIHPGQTLANLTSIMTGAELRLLTDTSREAAERTWGQMSELCDEYDQLEQRFRHGGQQLTRDQQEQLLAALERIDAELERYQEAPDPEDVAEAEKRETESLAPYTLVAREKGGRKIGTILENMTIKDFYLFRLMIRTQISNRDPNNRIMPDVPEDGDFDAIKQRFKFRAELLDVSIPRDDSLETAEQWAHTRHQIAVYDNIPLPNGEYFIDEYVLLFREVLDRKSSSAHKLTKRLNRACLIAGALGAELRQRGELDKRVQKLNSRFDVLPYLLRGAEAAPASLVVVMRMFEQLVDSYDLEFDEKLARDSALVISRGFGEDLRRILTTELTHTTFLELMRIYSILGQRIYDHTFVLAGHRRKLVSDTRLREAAQQVMRGLRGALDDDDKRIRCAVVEEFAIAAHPDLPESLKENLPGNVLKILVHTTANDSELLRDPGPLVQAVIDLAPGQIDSVASGNVLYFRINQQSDLMSEQERQDAGIRAGKAVFLKIEVVVDPAVEWVVPAHERDLRTIAKQYRRSLPRYTEYQALNRRKAILRQLETALATF